MKMRAVLWAGCMVVLSSMLGCGTADPSGDMSQTQTARQALRRNPTCVQTELCIIGDHWSPTQCQCVPDGSCIADDDCRVFADYCAGCDCRALSTEEPDPACDGPGVNCFADPCLGKTPICVDGQCMASPCVDTQLCIRGFRWSPQRCMCVPDRPHRPHGPGGTHAPHGPHAPHVPGH